MVAVAGMSRMAGGVTGSMPSPAFDLRGFLFEGQDVKWSFFTFGSIIELLEIAASDSNEATSARARLQKEKVEFDRQFNDFWCSLSSAEKKMHDGILRKFSKFSKEVNSLLHMPQPHGWSCGTTKDRFREALSQLKDVKMDFAATQNSVDLQDQFASMADTFQIVTAGLHPEQAELVREMSKLIKIFVRGHDTAYERYSQSVALTEPRASRRRKMSSGKSKMLSAKRTCSPMFWKKVCAHHIVDSRYVVHKSTFLNEMLAARAAALADDSKW
ncbi:hypothetical protein FISHEDRAFT_55309 [Fistulina hepatica ATCC 64428]|uniref:Uncharacterized protein n=1 Tax=Fistulina hepatica ATCC 64428 TaxID=1128425 RepID=A0A0D7AR05_9AGAR|nr:hypothetical protein FISHEDRAFT_55309 [Fistulina hepatica ATCC 64428]